MPEKVETTLETF